MVVDGDALVDAPLAAEGSKTVFRELCRANLDQFEKAIASGEPVQIACRQEAPLFREVAQERGVDPGLLTFTDIRDAGGWSEAAGSRQGVTGTGGQEAANVRAKMTALLAGDRVPVMPAPSVTIHSNGVCLVYGRGQEALDAAAALRDRLSVSVVLSHPDEAIAPSVTHEPIHRGTISKVKGALGAFQIEINGYASALPSSKDALAFAMPRDGARSDCDVILDLSDGPALISAGGRRDGYFKVDPSDRAGLMEAMFKLTDLVGEFEKPKYVAYDAAICAHARSGQVGCTNCLDVCPLGAISPDGDTVVIDAKICGGCGNCASACPTGAVSYTLPERNGLMARIDAIVGTYLAASGMGPRLLLIEEQHGADVISAMARYGRGLPSNVLPVLLPSVLSVGHEVLVAARVAGAEHIVLAPSPKRRDELQSLEFQTELADMVVKGLGYDEDAFSIIVESDPDVIEDQLFRLPAPRNPVARQEVHWIGSKREIARAAFAKLAETAPQPAKSLALPNGAPYGRIIIDDQGCTLCLACVGACPANALSDSPERPEVAFTEAACVQCGVCVSTCPESVISLEPRLNLASEALSPVTLNSEEPFECVSCGVAFGSKSTVETVVERLRGHSMFPDEQQLRLIQMCDNCRIQALANSADDPFRGADRPKVRTTDAYLEAEQRLAEEKASPGGRKTFKPDDFLS